ncbi:MAG: hypothetical protein HC804_07070 [Anaerolineae bacterium]|nr:hypothetical protein [Anaerolineae bacterium]
MLVQKKTAVPPAVSGEFARGTAVNKKLYGLYAELFQLMVRFVVRLVTQLR